MQNKGAIKFLAIILAIACAYQLSFTLVTKNVEKKALSYPKGEQAYLDSVRNLPVYNLGFIKFDYQYCKEHEINLGLDLRGGMNVMLEITVEDLIRSLSNYSKDEAFNAALTEAKTAQDNSNKDYLTLFSEAYDRLAPEGRLSYIFDLRKLQKVTATSSNSEVIAALKKECEAAVENSFNVLSNRINHLGVASPNIQRVEGSNRIMVELPGVKDPERVRKLLQGTASLEFWTTYDNTEFYPILVNVNNAVKTALAAMQPAEENVEAEAESADSLLNEMGKQQEAADQKALEKEFPLFAKLTPMAYGNNVMPGSEIGCALPRDTAAVNHYLAMPQVKAILPRDVKFMWSFKPERFDQNDKSQPEMFRLYAIKITTPNGIAPLDGMAVADASDVYEQTQGGYASVSMRMTAKGAETWAQMTANNVGKHIAIVMDGYVYSAPRVNEKITGGSSSITGNFSSTEARDLANVLKSGKLPAPAKIIQDTVVGPSLGKESIEAGMTSFALAFVLVLIYMAYFYNRAGMYANIALLANLFFLFGVLASINAVLTLPGIAGIVLTMGMAVDANVIIFERIKEELRAGKGLSQSISDGFSNAISAVVDGNLTTLITGIALLYGKGPVRGFATTLIIGILTSMFSAIFLPRLMFVARLAKEKAIKFSNKFTENFLTGLQFDFIGKRKVAYIVSGSLILISLISLATRGMQFGVDFLGGRSYVVKFDRNVTANEVREAMGSVFTESYEVKQFGEANQMRIVTQYKYNDMDENVSSEIEGLFYKALLPLYDNKNLTLEEFTTNQNPLGIISSDKVGATVAHDMKTRSIIAVIISLIAIGVYISLRFGRWQWALGGVAALTHDALLTIGLFSLLHGLLPFNLEVDQTFIAAILTIIGYSINDTVVIFDRIREYKKLYPKRSLRGNINNAVASTLARTINTSGTTLVVLLAILLFGGEVIRGFVFAIMFGVIIGTFSTIFIATPIAYDVMSQDEKAGEDK